MLIYDQSWLRNLDIQEETAAFKAAGKLSPEEYSKIREAYPVGFYSPNIFIRIGLFLLTLIIASFSAGILLMLCSLDFSPAFTVLAFFFGIISYIILEVMVKRGYHFRSGVDDALLWISGCSISTAIYFLMDNSSAYDNTTLELLMCLIVIALSLLLTLRFADRVMALTAYLSVMLFAIIALSQFKLENAFAYTFLIALISGLVYFYSKKYAADPKYVFYKPCLEVIQIAGLLFFYMAGNYFAISHIINKENYSSAEMYTVPTPYLFWAWTVILPFVYVGYGLRRKDAVLLRSGLILISIAAFTFRNYYHVMPIEASLVILGVLLLGISYYAIRYLKTPKKGFTYEDLNEKNIMDHLKVESLLVANMDTGPAAPETPAGDRFGGGNFGGGGSSGDF